MGDDGTRTDGTAAQDSRGYRLLELSEFEFAFPVPPQDQDRARRQFLTLLVDPSEERTQGSAGYVRKALDLSRTHAFAVKGLLDGTGTPPERAEAALREEYRTQLRLSQLKGFPRLYGLGQAPGGPVIVMEWVEGKSLARAADELLAATEDRFALAAQIGRDLYAILAGMGVLSAQMVHRDLSPSNVMVRTSGTSIAEQARRGRFDLCVVDFGSTTLIDDFDPRFTVNTSILRHGTPEYAPPEMLADSGPNILELRQSPSIDVYAAASIVYEIACGHTPYQLARHPGEPPTDVKSRSLPPALAAPGHDRLCDAIMRALSPRQAGRPTATQMRDACAADAHDASTPPQTPWRSVRTAPNSPFKAKTVHDGRSIADVSGSSGQDASSRLMTRRQLVGGISVGAAAMVGIGLSAFALGRRTQRPDGAGGEAQVSSVAAQASLADSQAAYCAKDAESGLWGFLDAQRRWVVAPRFVEPPRLFSDDLAAAKDPDAGRWGYLDTSGSWAIDPAFDTAGDFSEELAFACKRDSDGQVRLGWLGLDGSWSLPLALADGTHSVAAGAFFSGLAPLGMDDAWGYVGTDGSWAIDPTFRSAMAFSEDGLACVVDSEGRFGWIDLDGSWAIDPGSWSEAHTFHEGLAAVSDPGSGLWGFIDASGSLAVPTEFADVRDFHSGLAAARQGSDALWGYVDTTGAWAIEPTFLQAGDFIHGMAPSQDPDTGLFGYIDDTGAWVFSPEFADADFDTRAKGVSVTLA